MTVIKEDINRWRDSPRSSVRRINCENDYTTKHNVQIQCNPYQIIMTFSTELEQKISQFTYKHKRPQIAKAVLRKKNGDGRIKLPKTSDYTIKLQSSRQYGTGTKTEILINGTR